MKNMKTLNMFVSLLFLSGALGDCSYREDLRITTPQKMEALSGSCLKIPCTFTALPADQFNRTRESSAIWIRDHPFGHNKPHYEIYNSKKKNDRYPMKLTGNLQETNCTTEFFNLTTVHSDTYYFRIINLPFKATAVCSPLEIVVKDSPWSPTLEVSGDTPTDLKETQSVTITCSAPTPCPHSPPGLTWSPQRPAHSQMEEDRRGTFITKIQQDVTLSERHDGRTITCSAVYPVDGGEAVRTSEANFTLSVSYAPKETSASISPAGVVSVGSWVNLTCSCRARPAAIYTWFKTSDRGAVRVSGGNFHSFIVTKVTDGGVYYCVTHNALGNQTSERLYLNVEESHHQKKLVWLLVGIFTLVFLLVCICILIRWRRSKQTKSNEQVVQSEMAGQSENEGDNIHYGEISFSQHKPESTSRSEVSRTQEVTEYAEVKSFRPTADAPEDLDCLYAEVKKK